MNKIMAAFLFALLAACGGDEHDIASPGTVQSMADASGTSGDSSAQDAAQSANDGQPGTDEGASDAEAQASFLADAYQFATGELALAILAIETTSNENVLLLAQRLLAQQTQLIEQIGFLATARAVPLPDQPTEQIIQALQTLAPLSGSEFDRAYTDGTVSRHQEYVLRYGERAWASSSASASAGGGAQSGGAIDLQTFASNALPAQQLHLQAAKTVAGTLDPAAFLSNLYQQGLSEIELSQLALERSDNARVQAYAQRMIDDHTQANQQIATQAQASGVALPQAPSEVQRALAQELARLSADNFDKAYMNHNVLVHEVALAQAMAQSQEGTDAGVAALAVALEPVLLLHLEDAEVLYMAIEPMPLFAVFDTGHAEILLAQLALQESTDPEVLQYASRLLEEYSAANEQARQLAQQTEQGLPPEPWVEAARAYVALALLPEQDFDSAFLERNALLQEDAVQMLATAQADVAEVQALVAGLLPLLREQLDVALALQQDGVQEEAQQVGMQ